MCDFVLLPQARELSVKLDPYIRTQRRDWDGEAAETHIWPLIKQVEVTLPKSELIPEGVVLVDIPGTGDFNSKRDEMWKKVILCRLASLPLPTTPPLFLNQQRMFCLQLRDFMSSLEFKICLLCSKPQDNGRRWVGKETKDKGIMRSGSWNKSKQRK